MEKDASPEVVSERPRTAESSGSAAFQNRCKHRVMGLQLTDTGALVTGAAGGIGAATAQALAAEGARVAVHYRSGRVAAESLADEIGGVALQADLRDEAAAQGRHGRGHRPRDRVPGVTGRRRSRLRERPSPSPAEWRAGCCDLTTDARSTPAG